MSNFWHDFFLGWGCMLEMLKRFSAKSQGEGALWIWAMQLRCLCLPRCQKQQVREMGCAYGIRGIALGPDCLGWPKGSLWWAGGLSFKGCSQSSNREAFCSTKTQSPPRKRQAGPILGLKDKHINLLLTPSWAGLECLPSLSIYEVDKSLEKQDYTHRTLQRQVAVVSCSKTSSALPARAAGWWEHCGRGSKIHLSPSLSSSCPYPCPQDSLAKQSLPCTSSPPQAAGDAGQQLPLPWTLNLLFASAWCFPFIPDGTWLES